MTDLSKRDGAINTPNIESRRDPNHTARTGASRCWEQRVTQPHLPPEVQPLKVEAEISPEVDGVLSSLARAARGGDPDARNALYTVLEAKIHRFVRRYRGGSWGLNRSWSGDDLGQEAFLVFADLITEWTGEASFAPYFLSHFPWRLRDAVRRLNGRSPYRGIALPVHDLLSDDTAASEAAIAILEALAAGLPETSRAILLWHVRDGERFNAIATRLGISRRTVHRHWEATLEDLRRSLRAASGSPASHPRPMGRPGTQQPVNLP